MYKNLEELKQANGETYNKIMNTLQILHSDTGFRGLIRKIRHTKDEDFLKLYNMALNEDIKHGTTKKDAEKKIEEWLSLGVFGVIENLEQSGQINKKSLELTVSEEQILENAVLENSKSILQRILNDEKVFSDMEMVEKQRFQFTPEQIHKYHFMYACDQAAMAFAYENSLLPESQKIPQNDIKFIISTRWNKLHNGKTGHVVPCVRMADSLYYAFDPQINPNPPPTKNEKMEPTIRFMIPGYTEKGLRGRVIFHVLRGHDNTPYMITKDLISPKKYEQLYLGKHDFFLQDASMVNYDDTVKFLQEQLSAGNLTSENVHNYLSKINKIYDYSKGRQTINLKDALNTAKLVQSHQTKSS